MLSVAEHGEDDVAASAGEADQGGVVPLALGSLAVVEGLRRRISQRGERGEEHGVLQPVVAPAALGFAVDGLAGLAGDWGQAGVGGQPGAVSEPGAVADLGQDPGPGPRPDPGQGREQFTERVAEEDLLDLGGQGVAAGIDAV
jgi:hypothetical protein